MGEKLTLSFRIPCVVGQVHQRLPWQSTWKTLWMGLEEDLQFPGGECVYVHMYHNTAASSLAASSRLAYAVAAYQAGNFFKVK